MKKIILLTALSSLLFIACNDITYKLEGMWQLKTTTDDSGQTTSIDSIYYSFQKGEYFGYTLKINDKYSVKHFGQTYFPSDNQVIIEIEESFRENFLDNSDWNNYIETFEIKEVTSSRLVLFSEKRKKLYTFRKF